MACRGSSDDGGSCGEAKKKRGAELAKVRNSRSGGGPHRERLTWRDGRDWGRFLLRLGIRFGQLGIGGMPEPHETETVPAQTPTQCFTGGWRVSRARRRDIIVRVLSRYR